MVVDARQMNAGLGRLKPEQPWTHLFEVAGVHTIEERTNETFYRKAVGLQRIGDLALRLARNFSVNHTVAGKRVLDIACGEGGHSIAFAEAGALNVLGVEGRQLYVDRASFIANAKGLSNVLFQLGDVRAITPEKQGTFDVTLCFGILHHLGQDDFFPFLKSIADVTEDLALFYTHISHPDKVDVHRLKGPVISNGRFEGYLFREHEDSASDEQKKAQVRASLDNTFSFWATDEALMRALRDAGFEAVLKVYEPHVFNDYLNRNFRQVMVAKKKLV